MSKARRYQTPEDMQKKIDEYFDKGMNTRTVIVGKGESQQVIEIPIPTISGLCLYLGFESRQSFYNYSNRYPEFDYTIKKAKFQMAMHYEEQLQSGNTVGGIFALKNFGWSDKQEISHTGSMTNNINVFDGVDTATKEKILDDINKSKKANDDKIND